MSGQLLILKVNLLDLSVGSEMTFSPSKLCFKLAYLIFSFPLSFLKGAMEEVESEKVRVWRWGLLDLARRRICEFWVSGGLKKINMGSFEIYGVLELMELNGK